MAKTARQHVFDGMETLPDGLVPFVEERLRNALKTRWRVEATNRVPNLRATADGRISWDQQGLLKTMTVFWKNAFATVLGHAERSYVSELLEVRNRLAHNDAFTHDDAERALDTMRRLLEAVGAKEIAEKIGNERDKVLRVKYAELVRDVADADKALARKEQAAREAKRAEQAEQNTPTFQWDWVDRDFAGPTCVFESAGTGQYDGAELLKQFNGNKSAAIRYLAADGLKYSQIAKILGIRYQFAYNVLKADAGKEGRGR